MGILSFESIDSFVANGVADAAKRVGIDADTRLNEAGNRADGLKALALNGDSLAYVAALIADSFKKGFPAGRIARYVFDRQIMILPVIDTAFLELKSSELYMGATMPLMKDAADFLLLAAGVYPPFLKVAGAGSDIGGVKLKVAMYYSEASAEVRDKGKKGLAEAIVKIAKDVDSHYDTMRVFAREQLNQKSN